MKEVMTSAQIREKFLKFFEKRGHAIIPSAPLVPENDPTVLFNTAGMQPLVPYLMGKPHPQGDKLANIQKCVRTTDIEDVGDNTHLTFFEMMGNWSLGSYFKEDAIKWSYELLTSKEEGFGLDPKRLYVTVFKGDTNVPPDFDAQKIWESVGVPAHRIYSKDASANWWPAVKGEDTWTGPTGPCSEMFYDLTPEGLGDMTLEEYNKADDEQKVVEIWNDVFMEYEKKDGKILGKLAKKNVDTGAGFERIVAVLQGKSNVFETDLFVPLMTIAGKIAFNLRSQRIISDHIRSSVLLISDGVIPGNTDQGYVLRRLLRRAIFNTDARKMEKETIVDFVNSITEKYGDTYSNIVLNKEKIIKEIFEEAEKFTQTLADGFKEFEKFTYNFSELHNVPIEHVKTVNGVPIRKIKDVNGMSLRKPLSGKDAFILFSTYGFPLELTLELAKEKGVSVDVEEFKKEFLKHQSLSRSGAEKKFKGGLGDTSDMSLRYHTATHLLHQALHDVLGDTVMQKGSNITPERLRFDFAHGAKMTDEEKKKVEDIVNEKIKEKLPMQMVNLPKEEAEKTGARHFFGDKYGDMVSVYFVGNDLTTAYSKEFCGGPHVRNTGELAGPEGKWVFKIQKEEAVSQGVRRIKATLT